VTSPWERALGAGIYELDPGLRSYFGQIPAGMVGRGSGVFDVVGTPKRWLWPVLAILALDGIVFPAWERDVPFTVTNRPAPRGTVAAKRVLRFPGTGWAMTDRVGITAAGLTDRLGRSGLLAATFEPSVEQGRLVLRSTGVTLRVGPLRIPFGRLAPRVMLVERREGDRQHVSLTLDAPIVGRIYEYAGWFRYVIEPEE
jgi:hypothetical protein